MALKKASKRVVISNHTKNSQGFHVRSKGVSLTQYDRNPLMLWLHQRPEGKADDVLPIGIMTDVRIDGEEITGLPAFDESDEFAMKLYHKFENGTLNMFSAGLRPDEDKLSAWSVDASGNLWLEKSALEEVSLVDIGANPDALPVKLYQQSDIGELIQLSAQYIQETIIPNFKKPDMKIELSKETVDLLKLSDKADATTAHAEIVKLVQKTTALNDEIVTLKADRDAEKQKAETLKTELEAEQAKTADAEVVNLVDGWIRDRKAVEGERDKLIKLAKADKDALVELMDTRTAQPKVEDLLDDKQKEQSSELKTLMNKSYDALDKAPKGQGLIRLRQLSEDAFQAKYKEKHGKKYGE